MRGYRHWAEAITAFILIFLIVCLVVSVTVSLFLSQVQEALGMRFSKEQINEAAIYTFFCAIALSLMLAVIFIAVSTIHSRANLRRVDAVISRLAQGDFSARLPVGRREDSFNQIARDINRLAQELGGIETLRLDFTANVSHELKSPLNVIQEYASLLCQPSLSAEETKEYTDNIVRETKRLSRLVSDILELNRLENQEIYPEKQEVQLSESLIEAVLSFDQAIEEKGLSLETDLDESIRVTSDPGLLYIIWRNIASNAVKFSPEGGCIRLEVKDVGPGYIVSIQDQGKGISKEEGAHIFDRFWRADSSRKTEGNGLGLAMVKRIVDILGLEIRVESAPGQGTKMSVRFPS